MHNYATDLIIMMKCQSKIIKFYKKLKMKKFIEIVIKKIYITIIF